MLYRANAGDDLAAYWGHWSLHSAGWDAIPRAVQSTWDAYLPATSRLVPWDLRTSVPAQLAVVALTALGLAGTPLGVGKAAGWLQAGCAAAVAAPVLLRAGLAGTSLPSITARHSGSVGSTGWSRRFWSG